MKQTGIPFIILCLFIASCGEKKEEPSNKYISAYSIIDKDIRNVDTSLFSIMSLNIIDSTTTDTSYIPREDFRKAAAEFLQLPDISDKKNSSDYTETSMFDETTGNVTITYTPRKDKKTSIVQQDVTVIPNMAGGDSPVKTIYINYVQISKDSSIEKKMLWQVNRSFQITTLRQLPAQPEKVTTLRVVWNEPQY